MRKQDPLREPALGRNGRAVSTESSDVLQLTWKFVAPHMLLTHYIPTSVYAGRSNLLHNGFHTLMVSLELPVCLG